MFVGYFTFEYGADTQAVNSLHPTCSLYCEGFLIISEHISADKRVMNFILLSPHIETRSDWRFSDISLEVKCLCVRRKSEQPCE